MDFIESMLRRVSVIPVLAIEDFKTAVPLAQSLVDGGLPVLEITLRTPIALSAVEAIVAGVPDVTVGVGTCTKPSDLQSAAAAGASFAVTPGTTDRLMAAAFSASLPLLPGVATASEIIRAQEAGLSVLKFFPAQSSGGVEALKAFAGPFPEVVFCPTGGITFDNAIGYLTERNVICVGGSWFAPPERVAMGDWEHIKRLAEAAGAL